MPPCVFFDGSFHCDLLVPHAPTLTVRDNFREIQVKVHVRNPGKDTWSYQGRGVVIQELSGHSSRVGKLYSTVHCRTTNDCVATVVRNLTTGKVMTTFGEVRQLLCIMICFNLCSDGIFSRQIYKPKNGAILWLLAALTAIGLSHGLWMCVILWLLITYGD